MNDLIQLVELSTGTNLNSNTHTHSATAWSELFLIHICGILVCRMMKLEVYILYRTMLKQSESVVEAEEEEEKTLQDLIFC